MLVFKLKPIISSEMANIYWSRRCVGGDLQQSYINFDPSRVYTPFAYHKASRMIFVYASLHGLIVAGGDVANTYLYGKIECTVYIGLPTNWKCIEERPDMGFRVL